MGISREYIIEKVEQAIEQLPSNGLVLRENIDRYNEKIGYNKIGILRGVLYSDTNRSKTTIVLSDKGQILPETYKNYLVVFTDKVKQTDLIFIEDKVYKVADVGENMKMYCEMKLEEVQGIKLDDNNVIENDYIYEITEIDSEYQLKFE